MNVLLYPFWNAEERRPRAFWRVVLFVLVLFLLTTLFNLLVDRRLPLPGNVLSAWEVLLATFAALALAARLWDRRPFGDYGFHLGKMWGMDFLFGLILGGALMTGIFLAEWALGWARIVAVYRVVLPHVSFWQGWMLAFLLFVAVGFEEEMLTRGYLLLNLAEGFRCCGLGPRGGAILAWLVTSSVFGLLHLGNPHMTPMSTANLILAGLFLGLGYLLTGDLALPIGIHISWNFFQGNVFGFPVSGLSLHYATLFATQYEGPTLWTGGPFGPEGGLLGNLAILVGIVLVLLWTRRVTRGIRTHDLFTLLARPRRSPASSSRTPPVHT